MLGPHAIRDAGSRGVLTGAFLETDFAAFLAWRDFGSPDPNACNGFRWRRCGRRRRLPAWRNGAAYRERRGDLFSRRHAGPARSRRRRRRSRASAKRELFEETGIRAEEAEAAPDWVVVRAPGRVACMKPMTMSVTARRQGAHRLEPRRRSEGGVFSHSCLAQRGRLRRAHARFRARLHGLGVGGGAAALRFGRGGWGVCSEKNGKPGQVLDFRVATISKRRMARTQLRRQS